MLTNLNSENVTYGSRCGFCNGLEEADGTLGVEIAPGEFMEIPVGPNCLERMQDSSVEWVDKPETI